MRVGYVRVSTVDQNTVRQDVLMEQLGVDEVYVDKASGKSADRPQLKAMLAYVRKGDCVVVESYSRLARNVRDLLDIVDKLSAKGVDFVSKKENIDTRSASGRLMLTIFGSIYEFELACSKERILEGVHEAKKRGVYKGRQPIKVDWTAFGQLYNDWKANKITAVEAQKRLNLNARTFYRKVKVYEDEHR